MLSSSSQTWRAGCILRSHTRWAKLTQRRYNSSKNDIREPLKILFCGSDEFSITSLQALHKYYHAAGSKIASIDVATKSDKRVGRGLVTIKSPPIKDEALKLQLPLHQFDTFRGWALPANRDINMIIAVSFGLLVPPRILTACRYGGLNVHPSLLPDLKGSSPIEHAIMHGYERTGVTVQTLHPSKFDEGQIVSQTPAPGIDIPFPDQITTNELREKLAHMGAEMLIRVLDEEMYLSPVHQNPPRRKLKFAPKLHKDDERIDLVTTTSQQILRKYRALGNLWVLMDQSSNGGLRLILSEIQHVESIHETAISQIPNDLIPPGTAFTMSSIKPGKQGPDSPLFLKTVDGPILAIKKLAVSGQRMGSVVSEKALRNAKLLEPGCYEVDGREVRLLKRK